MPEINCCRVYCDGDLDDTFVTDGECGVYQQVHSVDGYDGTYEVTPKFENQTLPTRAKLMRDNVTVDAINVSRVSNPAGGNTVYIGGLINYA